MPVQPVTGMTRGLTAHTPPPQVAQLRAQQDLQIDLKLNDDENGSHKQRRLKYEQPVISRSHEECGRRTGLVVVAVRAMLG